VLGHQSVSLKARGSTWVIHRREDQQLDETAMRERLMQTIRPILFESFSAARIGDALFKYQEIFSTTTIASSRRARLRSSGPSARDRRGVCPQTLDLTLTESDAGARPRAKRPLGEVPGASLQFRG
jgi:hypothetical protein